ncbi:hypothetical protein [Aulosira sp. FACHB-615]|uniref:hypothetical protein n=1 Tax=Aulosira sp. FACHB-615 TaxID=2692777 RepID=UPI001689B78B|nr:hypothetical protein [Aulosira sp. FACHB-615]MBD2489007.1 hypothetical protein [Aulosira sp. FACHB-615]
MTEQFPSKTLDVYEIPRIVRVQTHPDIEQGRLNTTQLQAFYQVALVPKNAGLEGNAVSVGPWQDFMVENTPEIQIHLSAIAVEIYRQIQERKLAASQPQPEPQLDDSQPIS